MPQPSAFPGFPCEQPVAQSKQDARKLLVAAAPSGAFQELVSHLVLEHERVLARNGELRAEVLRLRAAAPPAQAAPWDAEEPQAPCAEAEALGARFPASTAGRRVLASERQLEAAPGWAEAPAALASVWLVDAGTQTGAEAAGARCGKAAGAEAEEELAREEAYCVGASEGEELKCGDFEGCEDRCEDFEGCEDRCEDASASAPPSEEEEGEEAPRGAPKIQLKRSNSMSSHASTTSVAIRRYSSNGRMLPKPMMALYRFLEDSESSRMSLWYKMFMQGLLCMSVGTPLLQMVDPPLISGFAAAIIETTLDCIFTLELVARLVVNPAPRTFFCKVFNVIDLFTPVFLVLRFAVGFEVVVEDPLSAAAIVLLCVVPMLRLLKILRRWDTIHLLTKAFIDVFEALPVLLFPLVVITLLFSFLIYIVEPRDNIPSLAKAVWLTMVTMTTVGYGDVTPESATGSFVVGTLVISSVMYMAMPLAILGSSFTQVWQDRDTVLLMHRTRERLQQWGYSVHDIPVLFQVFDRDSSGELNAKEFARMMNTMKLGLKDEQILSLYRTFDADGSGEVDDKEFVRTLFPGKFVEVYGSEDCEDEPENALICPS